MIDTSSGILAGMSEAQLRAALATAQKAYIDLQIGQKVVSVSYAQGNGSRSITYQPTDLPQVTALIQAIQRQLGIGSSRRAVRFIYR
jgi:hypothetical protein